MARYDGKQTKRRAKKLSLTELSGVTVPAHRGADVTILKVDGTDKISFEEALGNIKNMEMVQEMLNDFETLDDAVRHSIMSILNNPEEYPNPVEAINFSLQRYSARVQDTFKNSTAGTGNPKGDSTMGDENMVTAATHKAVQDQVTDLQQTVTTLKAENALSNEHRDHYRKLAGAEAEAFLKMTQGQRSDEIEKAQNADPVVYTSTDGTEFRKSAGETVVAMAKQLDETNKALEKEQSLRKHQQCLDKAASLNHLKGETDVKVALIKAIDTLEEADATKVHEMLKAANFTSSDVFTNKGTSEPGNQDLSKSQQASANLDAMCEKYASDNSVSITKAYDAVLQTEAGAKLYEQANH